MYHYYLHAPICILKLLLVMLPSQNCLVLARALVTFPLVFLGQIFVPDQYFLLDVSVLVSVWVGLQ